MQIGEVAEKFGIATSAVRYYERAGLLPNVRRRSGAREFSTSDVNQLGLIRLAQRAGFSIKEIHDLLYGFSTNTKASTRWRKSAEAKRSDVSRSIEEAQAMLKVIDTLLECECPTLEDCGNAYQTKRFCCTSSRS